MPESPGREGPGNGIRPGTRWTIPRSDLDSGAAVLLRATHPLLPEFSSAGPAPEGVFLAPHVPRPLPLGSLDPVDAGPFLVRLLALASFLRWAGLGVGGEDLPRLGVRPGPRGRPWLAAPPVALWRSASPHLVAASAALRLARGGGPSPDAGPGGEGRETLRERLEAEASRAASSSRPEWSDVLAFARRALRAEEEGETAESLLAGLVPRARADGLRADLLGLVSPIAPEAGEIGGGAVGAAWGPAASWVLLGASRASTPPLPFLDLLGGNPLEEGSGLRALARGLKGDARSAWVAARSHAGGAGGRPACPPGPPTAVTLRGASGWDPRSRAALCGPLEEAGLRLFEERAGPPPPWEARVALRPLVDETAVSAAVWLPWPSAVERLEACERLAREAAGDPGRLLAAARRLALERTVGGDGGGTRPAARTPRRGSAEEPVLAAAAILAPGFAAEEAAKAAGAGLGDARDALERAVSRGLVQEAPAGRFTFVADPDRALLASSLSRTARRDAVVRLESAGVIGERLAVAALARGAEPDLARGASGLSEALARGGWRGRAHADLLLSRAPPEARDLGRPALAALAHAAAGRDREAREAACRAGEAELRDLPPDGRRVAARLLVRAGEVERALALAQAGSASGCGEDAGLERVRLLLLARRDPEAGREADAILGRTGPLPDGVAAAALLLAAEADGRLGDGARSRERLSRARELLAAGTAHARIAGGAAAAATAGFLASDLARPREAAFFFRLALDASAPAEKAACEVDLAVALVHAGDLKEAGRRLDSALSGFAAAGDEERWISALANRADLRLLAGDASRAREDLERVLAFDRRPGRERQLLFALPTRQEIALLEGDLAAAEAVFREARGLLALFPRHDAARHLLVLEGRRRLMAGEPAGAAAVLEEAGRLDDNRMADEPLRRRLLASAGLDASGGPAGAGPGTGGCVVREADGEGALLLVAESRMKEGLEPGRELLARLRSDAAEGRGAVGVAALVAEWWHRFPSFFATPAAGAWIAAGSAAASRGGVERLAALLDSSLRGLAARAAPAPRGGGIAEAARSRGAAVVAEDDSTRAALSLAAKVAPTRLTVLVLGETGTGKEVVAREVHRLSGRRGPFVAINVAALPETLAESELFGHARGAFSGADRERVGLVEASSGGTLFLDEVGELSLPVQAKLLRVLQEREVRRLGESRERPVDLRVVAATHRDLALLAREGRFREDLLWRLSGAEVRLLPLRERPRDLAALAARILAGRGALSPAARALLVSHAWPGNVRELASALESALALAGPDGRIGTEHLPSGLRPAAGPGGGGGAAEGGGEGSERYRRAVDGARRGVISRALGESAGNRSRAADWLGISRQSLLYEMRKLGVA